MIYYTNQIFTSKYSPKELLEAAIAILISLGHTQKDICKYFEMQGIMLSQASINQAYLRMQKRKAV